LLGLFLPFGNPGETLKIG